MMIVINIIILIISIYCFTEARHIKIQRNKQILQIQDKVNSIKSQWQNWEDAKQEIEHKIRQQQNRYEELTVRNHKYQQEQNELINKKQNTLESIYNNLKTQYENGYNNYVKTLDMAYTQKEQQFEKGREQIERKITQLQGELTATAAAKTREEERKNQLDFYKIQISDKQKQDIQKLEKFKEQLFDPSLVSKVIWSSCIMKPTGELCNRLTKGKTVCGIYKITSLISLKSYIGQSVNISDRIKQHVKCGLGIDAPSTNRLYNLMQKQGVYNFTFEILQECGREKLNERERFWIQTYQSDKFGVNSTGGNK